MKKEEEWMNDIIIPHIICSEICKPVLQCQQEMHFICSFQLTPFILQNAHCKHQKWLPTEDLKTAGLSWEGDTGCFLLNTDEMKPLCKLEDMSDARILSYGCRIFSQGFMERYRRTTEEGHFYFYFYFFGTSCIDMHVSSLVRAI